MWWSNLPDVFAVLILRTVIVFDQPTLSAQKLNNVLLLIWPQQKFWPPESVHYF